MCVDYRRVAPIPQTKCKPLATKDQVGSASRGRRLANRLAINAHARGGLEEAVEHFWVEVYLAGPFDSARLRIDADLLEDLAALVNWGHHAAARKDLGEVDLLDRAVGERRPRIRVVLALRRNDTFGRLRYRTGATCLRG
jgi:hypothetical protein